jgi:hypothetical protein
MSFTDSGTVQVRSVEALFFTCPSEYDQFVKSNDDVPPAKGFPEVAEKF